MGGAESKERNVVAGRREGSGRGRGHWKTERGCCWGLGVVGTFCNFQKTEGCFCNIARRRCVDGC
jgi:hypothetical protein